MGIGILFFFPFLGHVHLFDWDEINFAESAREMLETGNYFQVQINYEAFWEKPPFFFWLQVLSMKLFGINEFSARFPNALIGIISLITLYSIGKKMFSEKFGMFWALIYLASFLPHLYFKSGIIDPIFNFFIFLSIYYLAVNLDSNSLKKSQTALLSGIFIGLAIITKGPVGLLLLLLTFGVFLIFKKFRVKMRIKDVLIFILSSFSVTFIWFGYETITNSPWFIIEFVQYQIELFSVPVAGHEQPFYYHFLVVLLGCFPMSILALPMFKKINKKTPFDLMLWMKILFWVVLILFTIVKTKIAHYSSMSYLPLSFMATYFLYQLSEKKQIVSKPIKITFLIIGLIFSALLIIAPILFTEKEFLSSLLSQDKFASASLNVEMGWQGWEFIIGFIYFVAVILAYIFLNKGKIQKFVYFVAFSAGATLLLYSVFVVPKIEKFSQGPAIEFYESIKNEDCYVTTIGFKSYAHLFYPKIKISQKTDGISLVKEAYKNSLENPKDFNAMNLNTKVNNWLLKDSIDKKAYFVTKITEREKMKSYDKLILLKTVGGFDFYYRN